ncbi:MAG: bifunctional proline dehydrogenase/L-glutamate gamma-semialdehyde dehydrogenase PutA [Alphaproteobacteria bacterium]|nr:bifunctional proline dehydrogenase/L-glutamate gamma-semialdehyde dehydrogenase PutA [Alphaproteobacteria bacterium]MCB9975236.1 bifunctional proline dehydrogenase/L-glutamate gamma-semialdehyde dehydrogenase PutA [Rhodospirillales bacterium]
MNRSYSSFLYQSECQALDSLYEAAAWSDDRAQSVFRQAKEFLSVIRNGTGSVGLLENFLQTYALDTEEGLAMMTLAEALLRIPDKGTANLLIRDKVKAADWLTQQGGSADWLSKAAGLGMSLSRRTLESVFARLGQPLVREAMVRAMHVMGRQFVLGVDIRDAFLEAEPFESKGYRLSYDVLGEGARDARTAERYLESYGLAFDEIGKRSAGLSLPPSKRPSVSVKLSALYPRYEVSQEDRCVPVLIERLGLLAEKAAKHDLSLTIDAEEVARLDLSIRIFEGVLQSPVLSGWEGFGLAVQAYQKRALSLIKYLAENSQTYGRKIQIRLVKGAYWDSEIKRAQMGGYPDYPVFTRKCNTDVSYIACAQEIFRQGEAFFPLFATHNAHTIAAVLHMAREAGADPQDFELQRLHGMGERLFDHLLREGAARASIYAPIGPHEDLLPYLVRRLLENGANSSFVKRVSDRDVDPAVLLRDPIEESRSYAEKRHSKIPVPSDLFDARKNSRGLDLNDPLSCGATLDFVRRFVLDIQEKSLVDGRWVDAPEKADRKAFIDRAFDLARTGYTHWSGRKASARADILERVADLYEQHSDELMGFCVHEARKTIPDSVAEVREAVDFCRYYAQRVRLDFCDEGMLLPGYTGEENRLFLHGRGVFVCISPWNFPLAIFTGQIAAALGAGNAVVAKPAEQTPLIALRAVELFHRGGVPAHVLHLLTGDGQIGAEIVSHPDVAGVAFTGSTQAAKSIQRALATKDGPIVPLVAETGGQNAMIVDSSALLEQTVDDVILSAFGSTGQRCSALRVLYVQEDIAETFLELLSGAMKEIRVGDPSHLSTDIGPVIDNDALAALRIHEIFLEKNARLIARVSLPNEFREGGFYFTPIAYEISDIGLLKSEVFGPVLHVIRYKAADIEKVLQAINGTGFGLTFGVQSRINSVQRRLAQGALAGNVYVNRSMIGAVVGVQPFGGMGLSGTGPKAGGPHYLRAFVHEKVISVNTTAAGGNASLVSMREDE